MKVGISLFIPVSSDSCFNIISVCIGVLNKLVQELPKEDLNSQKKIEDKFVELCPTLKKAENRFVSKFLYHVNPFINSLSFSLVLLRGWT